MHYGCSLHLAHGQPLEGTGRTVVPDPFRSDRFFRRRADSAPREQGDQYSTGISANVSLESGPTEPPDESMFLGLPVPQIVLFQRQDGVLELIDGLQRVSSLITFITGKRPGPSDEDEEAATNLSGCDILLSLNGLSFADLGGVLQLELKRKTLRAIVIRRTNDPNLRYEMFKRLNSAGSPAEAHEIRNASLRIVANPARGSWHISTNVRRILGFKM